MDDALLDLLPEYECREPALQAVVAKLASLRPEARELRIENRALRRDVGYWKSRHADALERETKLKAEIEQLRGENRKLQDRLFGRKTEKAGESIDDLAEDYACERLEIEEALRCEFPLEAA